MEIVHLIHQKKMETFLHLYRNTPRFSGMYPSFFRSFNDLDHRNWAEWTKDLIKGILFTVGLLEDRLWLCYQFIVIAVQVLYDYFGYGVSKRRGTSIWCTNEGPKRRRSHHWYNVTFIVRLGFPDIR